MDIARSRQWPVQWHEGMLLSPQHFQQDQVYRESERFNELKLTRPYYWGVMELTYDLTALLSGTVIIRQVYGMMPDGLIVDYNDQVDELLEADLSDVEVLDDTGKFVTVHLVVPIRTEGAASYNATIQRFDSVPGESVVDENTGENQVEVNRLQPRIGLYVGESPPSRYVSMPLLRVQKDVDGAFKVTNYVPPILDFRVNEMPTANNLRSRCVQVVANMREKAVQLAGIARSDVTGLSLSERNKKWDTAAVIGSVLPMAEAVLEAKHAHPFHVFAVFCELMGRVAKLSDNPVPPKLPAYNHDDVNAGFDAILVYTSNLLSTIDSQFTMLRFDEDNERFSVETEGTENKVFTIELRAKKGQSQESLLNFINTARIASISTYPQVLQTRLLGAERRILSEPIFESKNEESNVIIQIMSSDQYIRPGERLVISSASEKDIGNTPESIWLYSTHES